MKTPASDSHADNFVPDPRRWLAMAVLLIAGFMNLIDITIVNVALPSLQKSLGATSSQMEWVVAAYVLAFALGLLPFGRLGDIVGRKYAFLVTLQPRAQIVANERGLAQHGISLVCRENLVQAFDRVARMRVASCAAKDLAELVAHVKQIREDIKREMGV